MALKQRKLWKSSKDILKRLNEARVKRERQENRERRERCREAEN